MANVQNPKNFVITPGAGVEGAAVSDYTIAYAAAPGNSPPAGFPVGAPQVLVPAKDLTPQADGTILVPIPDIVTNTRRRGPTPPTVRPTQRQLARSPRSPRRCSSTSPRRC